MADGMSDKDPHLLAYEGIYEAWFAHMPDSSSRRKKMVREFADAASAPWRKRVEALTAEVEHLRTESSERSSEVEPSDGGSNGPPRPDYSDTKKVRQR